MAKQCKICEKKGMMAWRLVKLRGKYNPTIKLKKQPNLQWVRPVLNEKRILACTKCIKAMSKT
ncbi:MAG: L28 family ribosomal protein [Candidatus Parcubacteria bacterium]|nr:L28 family ribosomal protein [Candidatus Parcubacteria bacterium]